MSEGLAGIMETKTSVAQTADRSEKPDWLVGLGRSMPIVLGYIPVGFAFGVLALEVGLSPLNTVLMSLLVLGAASQLVAVQLFALGVEPLTIVATTFIVNLRHMLMASAMAPYLRNWRRWQIGIFSYGLTDEAFALHSARFDHGGPSKGEAITINAVAHGSWVVGTWFGVIAGSLLGDVGPFGLDYALSAMFVALIVIQCATWRHGFVVILAGILGVAFAWGGLDSWAAIVATLIAATAGFRIEQWTSRKSF